MLWCSVKIRNPYAKLQTRRFTSGIYWGRIPDQMGHRKSIRNTDQEEARPWWDTRQVHTQVTWWHTSPWSRPVGLIPCHSPVEVNIIIPFTLMWKWQFSEKTIFKNNKNDAIRFRKNWQVCTKRKKIRVNFDGVQELVHIWFWITFILPIVSFSTPIIYKNGKIRKYLN